MMNGCKCSEDCVCATPRHSLLVSLANDESFSGKFIEGVAGEALAIGDVCRHDQSENKWYKADADATATSDGMLAMATGTIAQDATGVLLLEGFVRYDTWNWTIDDTLRHLYVDTTPGSPTQTAPSGSGEVVRGVGYPMTADIAYFHPDNSYDVVP